jgi:hypothetical protein
MTVVRLIKDGLLPAKQACIGAPYVIQQADLELPEVRPAIANAGVVSADPRQEPWTINDVERYASCHQFG